ncbi:MAG: hypothetical protein ACYCXA_06110 [Actinomycetes bacterium]
MRSWVRRRWAVSALGAVVCALLLGLPTDVIPNPVFGRAVPVTWWSYPVLAASAVLCGLLLATYVRAGPSAPAVTAPAAGRPRLAGAGALLSFFAIGCPVCNKVALLLLGFSGALHYFAPVQPYLALASLLALGEALRRRLAGERSCPTALEHTPG